MRGKYILYKQDLTRTLRVNLHSTKLYIFNNQLILTSNSIWMIYIVTAYLPTIS